MQNRNSNELKFDHRRDNKTLQEVMGISPETYEGAYDLLVDYILRRLQREHRTGHKNQTRKTEMFANFLASERWEKYGFALHTANDYFMLGVLWSDAQLEVGKQLRATVIEERRKQFAQKSAIDEHHQHNLDQESRKKKLERLNEEIGRLFEDLLS